MIIGSSLAITSRYDSPRGTYAPTYRSCVSRTLLGTFLRSLRMSFHRTGPQKAPKWCHARVLMLPLVDDTRIVLILNFQFMRRNKLCGLFGAFHRRCPQTTWLLYNFPHSLVHFQSHFLAHPVGKFAGVVQPCSDREESPPIRPRALNWL